MDSSSDKLFESTQAFLLDSALAVSKATATNYRFNLGRFASFVAAFDVHCVEAVSTLHVRDYLFSLQQKNFSSATVHQAYRVLRTFCGWCLREGLITTDPMVKVRRPKLTRPVPLYLSRVELEKLLAVTRLTTLPDRDYAIVMVFLDTGMRRGELAGLQVADLDIPARRVTVRVGKGRKGRIVPICSAAAHSLAAWLVARPKAFEGPVSTDSLFGLTGQGIHMLMQRLSRRVGFHVYSHALRHTFATHYSGDIQDVQLMLGHADISTTVGLYSHRKVELLVNVHDDRSPVAHLPKNK